MRLAVIGVPYNSAGLTIGEARAPAALRAAGLFDELGRSADVVDYGDVPVSLPTPARDPSTGIIAPGVLAEMVHAVRAAAGHALDLGHVPIVIGGECPLLLGCLAAARDAHGPSRLLFVDGHEDAWPPRSSTTGEAADMELGFALGLAAPHGVDDLIHLLPLVSADDVVVLGPRDRDEIAAAGLPTLATTVTFRDDMALRERGPAATTAALTNQLSDGGGRWWFHLDLDVLATDALAAVRYPQSGGLTWAELEAVTETALQTPGMVGWNITIYNPDLDPDGSGAHRIVAFLGAMCRLLS